MLIVNIILLICVLYIILSKTKLYDKSLLICIIIFILSISLISNDLHALTNIIRGREIEVFPMEEIMFWINGYIEIVQIRDYMEYFIPVVLKAMMIFFFIIFNTSMIIFLYLRDIWHSVIPELKITSIIEIKEELLIKYILNFLTGLNGLSIIMIILSTILFIVCIMSGKTIIYRNKLFFVLLFLTEIILINLFLIIDLFYFYILFEAVLIPMFLIIGIWGSRKEKVSAAYQFYIYTLIGSLFMLISIISILIIVGTTNIFALKGYIFPKNIENIFWISFFIAFAIKIPMYPFHLWLPKAHVEAPTSGSVLLAGILLKLGGYGFIKFSLFLFPETNIYYRPMIIVIALIGIIYSSFAILRQIDLKRIVAYSSIAHMNIFILGCFGGNIMSIQGAILLMIAHGLVSGGLFLCVGYLYDRYKTRNLLYYRDLKNIMPIFEIIFFLLMLANIGFPPSLNFMSEFLILIGIFENQQALIFLIGISIFFSGISGFLTFTRIFYGNFEINNGYNNIKYYYDVTRREFFSIMVLILLTFIIGIFPNIILNMTNFNYLLWGI